MVDGVVDVGANGGQGRVRERRGRGGEPEGFAEPSGGLVGVDGGLVGEVDDLGDGDAAVAEQVDQLAAGHRAETVLAADHPRPTAVAGVVAFEGRAVGVNVERDLGAKPVELRRGELQQPGQVAKSGSFPLLTSGEAARLTG
jgi:hypothetical protein